MEKYFCDVTGEEIPDYEEEVNMVRVGEEEYDLTEEIVTKVKQYIESLKTGNNQQSEHTNNQQQPTTF